jgi:hypothetical protein
LKESRLGWLSFFFLDNIPYRFYMCSQRQETLTIRT